MASTAASYQTPSLTEQTSPRPTTGQVCRDLEELCAQGFLEPFRDEYNIVRYRPVRRAQ